MGGALQSVMASVNEVNLKQNLVVAEPSDNIIAFVHNSVIVLQPNAVISNKDLSQAIGIFNFQLEIRRVEFLSIRGRRCLVDGEGSQLLVRYAVLFAILWRQYILL